MSGELDKDGQKIALLQLDQMTSTMLRELVLQSLAVLVLREKTSMVNLVTELRDDVIEYQAGIEDEAVGN